ncbi:hypothetical protein [Halorubellus litoreus]|uniref:Uncharacterized protein n=1 Tax=Halorubellus litoreus TaxID=755308 RepID=A0ABD5VMB1_9EURY
MVRIEDLVPGFVARRVPRRPEWVEENQRDPRTAARVYGYFAFGFSTLFFLVFAVGNPLALAYVPLVVANAVGWTWLLWSLRIPGDGEVSRRTTLTTGLAIGTFSWLTVGPLISTAGLAARVLGGESLALGNALGMTLGMGLFFSIWGFVFTLGIPTVASLGLALWMLDDEERGDLERRKSDYQFQ